MAEIKGQLIFLLGSFLSGVAVMLAYEAVNIFRGLFRPRAVGKFVADVLFFTVSAVFVFRMIFLCNNGTIRSFFLFAFGAGAILYRKTFGTLISGFVVRLIRRVIHAISRPFVCFCRKILKKFKKNEKKP
ncbi:MAG: spore cortex biosynthesis protein YabQ [Roseburia sp.]|nr:spore cortex biosynthesis protein YabQ [Roseburia sp.]